VDADEDDAAAGAGGPDFELPSDDPAFGEVEVIEEEGDAGADGE
jgi:hypothetical protein